MASLFKRNGTFYARFYESERGRRRVSLKTADKSTARALLAKFERLYLLGEADPWEDDMHAAVQPGQSPSGTLSLEEAFEDFLQSRREMNVTPNTLRTYRETVGWLVGDTGAEKPLKAFTAARVRSYIHAGHIAPATREKRYRVLRTFLRYHDCADVLESVEKPRPERKLPVACTRAELTAICDAMKEHYRECRTKNRMQPGDTLWRIPVFWTAFLTGLRRAELARLRWKDVDTAGRTITLRKQKRRQEERLPISKQAARLLRRVREGRADPPVAQDYVFAAPSAKATQSRSEQAFGNHLTRIFRRYRKRAGVRSEVNVHALRAGFITQLAKAGLNAVAIKQLARHADIKTSLRYIEATGEAFRASLEDAF